MLNYVTIFINSLLIKAGELYVSFDSSHTTPTDTPFEGLWPETETLDYISIPWGLLGDGKDHVEFAITW
jgi:hypothetical protein